MTGLGSASGHAQSLPSNLAADPRAPAVLDVPYLPQSVLLCGGAAVAMVERWWGRRGVYAEDFATLVRPALGGIVTTELDSATRARGWDTRVLYGTPALIQQHLREGVPVVALIQVGRDRYHYVVVLGWDDGRVVFHDPAGAPFTSFSETRFLTRWDAADRWALVILPRPAPAPPIIAAQPPVAVDPMPCAPWLDRAVDAAAANQLEEAARLLAEAGQACPAEPLVLRELAGVRFKQGWHAEAIRLAASYLALMPGDGLGWQLLGTSRYLTGDRDGALVAWNQIGRPTVDLVHIDGTKRTRFQAIASAVSIPFGTRLTPSGLALARRRVGDVPALSRAIVDYEPVPGGLAEVRVAVAEHPLVDRPWRLAAAGVLRAIAQNEFGLELASPTGQGELWTGHWRWEYARPRVLLRVDRPAALGLQGVLGIEGAWERVRLALDTTATTGVEDTWRSVSVGFGGWVTAGIRPMAAIRVERWSANRDYLAVSAGAELRARGDRFTVSASTEHAAPLSAHPSYSRASARALWASSLGLGRAAWSTRLGFEWVTTDAPLGSWPMAGGDLSWAIPLRAERFARGARLRGRMAGRGIIHAGLAGDVPVERIGPIILAAGLFLDGARVVAAADGTGEDRFYLDGGAGLRIGVAEGELGVLRIDLARRLRGDRRSALTVGVHPGWPPFQHRSR